MNEEMSSDRQIDHIYSKALPIAMREELEPLTPLEPETLLTVNDAKIYLLKKTLKTSVKSGTVSLSKNDLALKDARIITLRREVQNLKSEVNNIRKELLEKEVKMDSLKKRMSSCLELKPNTIVVSKNALTVKDAEIYLLKNEVEMLKAEVERGRNYMTFDSIRKNKSWIHQYTGLPSEEAFLHIVDLLKKSEINYHHKSKVSRIPIEEQLLCTLMKLKLSLPSYDLSYRFGVSETSITNIFVTFLGLLHQILVVDNSIEKISFNPGNSKKSYRMLGSMDPNFKLYADKIDEVCAGLVNLSKYFISLEKAQSEVTDTNY